MDIVEEYIKSFYVDGNSIYENILDVDIIVEITRMGVSSFLDKTGFINSINARFYLNNRTCSVKKYTVVEEQDKYTIKIETIQHGTTQEGYVGYYLVEDTVTIIFKGKKIIKLFHDYVIKIADWSNN